MAEIATKPKPVAKIPQSHKRGMPAARVAVVVDKTAELSSEVLQSLEGERTDRDSGGRAVRDHHRGDVATGGRGYVRCGQDDHRVVP